MEIQWQTTATANKKTYVKAIANFDKQFLAPSREARSTEATTPTLPQNANHEAMQKQLRSFAVVLKQTPILATKFVTQRGDYISLPINNKTYAEQL